MFLIHTGCSMYVSVNLKLTIQPHISVTILTLNQYTIFIWLSPQPQINCNSPPPNQKMKNEVHKRNIDYSIPNFTSHHLVSTFAEVIIKLLWVTSQFKLLTVINKALTNKKVNPIHSYTLAHKNKQDQRTWQTFLTL